RGLAIAGGGLGVFVVEHVGVAESEIGRGGGFARMLAGVAFNTGVGSGGASGSKLLRHRTQLLGGMEGAGEADGLGGGTARLPARVSSAGGACRLAALAGARGLVAFVA